MIVGLLILVIPSIVFLITLPISNRLKPQLRWLYRFVGGTIVIVGSSFSMYLAAYTGDQGGIGAFFFQIAVIVAYILLSVLILAIHWFVRR